MILSTPTTEETSMKRIEYAMVLLLIFLWVCGLDMARAGINEWTTNGPEGGAVFALAIDPKFPATLYAGTAGNGVFKTTDGATRWKMLNMGQAVNGVRSLAIDPSTPNVVYAGTSKGVLKTTNSGKIWGETGLKLLPQVIIVNPRNPDVLYAGTWSYFDDNDNLIGGGVHKTTDGGASWTRTGCLPEEIHVNALAIDPVNPDIVYAGTLSIFNGGRWVNLFKTTDGGKCWCPIVVGSGGHSWALAIDPVDTRTLYAGTEYGVFKSTDGGTTWTEANNGLRPAANLPLSSAPPGLMPGINVRTLTIDPTNPMILYVSVDWSGVFKTTDGGGYWFPANVGLPDKYFLDFAIDPVNPNILYVATNSGPFRSVDGGSTWMRTKIGLISTEVQCLALDSVDPSILYAGTSSNGVFKSTNGGTSWKAAKSGLGNSNIVALAIDPVHPNIVYAATFGSVFKSIDSGATWNATGTGLEGSYIYVLVIDPINPDVLYAGTFYGVYKSISAGATWSPANTGLNGAYVNSLAIDPISSNTLYAGTSLGLFKSTDGGESWNSSNTGLPGNAYVLSIHPYSTDILYAGTYEGVFKSIDGGANWSVAGVGLTSDNFRGLAIDPTNPDVIYSGACYGGVFRSTDAGGSWSPLNAGLVNDCISALAINPENPNILHAATFGGVYSYQQPGSSLNLTLFAPHGGETIPAGSNFTITWGGPPEAVKFKVSHSKDNGVTWIPLHQDYVRRTNYDWPVPVPKENKPVCLVKVVGFDEIGNRVGADKSDYPFTIEVVKLTSPDGFESIPAGSTQTITWQTAVTRDSVASVELSSTVDGGYTWKPILTLTEDLGSYDWPVPSVRSVKTKCKIKVVLKAANGVILGADSSDSYFMIRPSP